MRISITLTILGSIACSLIAIENTTANSTRDPKAHGNAAALARIMENPVGPAFLQSVAPDLWTELNSAHESEAACSIYAPGTPEWYIAYRTEKFNKMLATPERFQPHASRWGSGGSVTLYYSFPPDGISLSGYPDNENSNFMHDRWTTAFGDEATWKDLFAQVFDEWAHITGNTYIEIDDDGAS
jgi:hypothetical protein